MIYCLLPSEVSARVERNLRRFYADADIEVIAERRSEERRQLGERRRSEPRRGERIVERRRIRNSDGRRIAERRASLVPIHPPEPLPRRAGRLEGAMFVETLDVAPAHQEDIDSARLVTRVQGGDTSAFAELYERYFDRVYTYFRIATKDTQVAVDATRDVFLSVAETVGDYPFGGEHFRAWLFRIVRDCSAQIPLGDRRFKQSPPAEPRTRDRLPSGALDWISDDELMLFVERLPAPERQVMLLRYMLELDWERTADVSGRSPEDVRDLQLRALDVLEARLTEAGRGQAAQSRRRLEMTRARVQQVVLRARRLALAGS